MSEIINSEVRRMPERKSEAIIACARWLQFCLRDGWAKEDLDRLQKIWWDWHDRDGKLSKQSVVEDGGIAT